MAAGGSIRRRPVVADDGGDTAGLGDFTAPCECLSSLRSRPLGKPVAKTACPGRSDHRAVRRRLRHGFPAPRRRGAMPPGTPETLRQVRPGTSPGKDPSDRVRPLCGRATEKRGEGKPETFNFLGFTHCCGKTRKGAFTIKRKSIAKRIRAKLQNSNSNLFGACTARWSRSGQMAAFRGTRMDQLPCRTGKSPVSTSSAPKLPGYGCTSCDGAARKDAAGHGSG